MSIFIKQRKPLWQLCSPTPLPWKIWMYCRYTLQLCMKWIHDALKQWHEFIHKVPLQIYSVARLSHLIFSQLFGNLGFVFNLKSKKIVLTNWWCLLLMSSSLLYHHLSSLYLYKVVKILLVLETTTYIPISHIAHYYIRN